MRRIIDERWAEKLTLGALARSCGLHRAKLTRGFRDLYRCSVAEALAERRLGEASRALRTTDLPVSTVAYANGYLNNASFSRAFGLTALAGAMAADTDDLARITRHDVDFHHAIARASRNALFLQIVQSFAPLMQIAVPVAWRTRAAVEQRDIMIDRYRAVAAAIAGRDEAGARVAMDAHFDASIGVLLGEVALDAGSNE